MFQSDDPKHYFKQFQVTYKKLSLLLTLIPGIYDLETLSQDCLLPPWHSMPTLSILKLNSLILKHILCPKVKYLCVSFHIFFAFYFAWTCPSLFLREWSVLRIRFSHPILFESEVAICELKRKESLREAHRKVRSWAKPQVNLGLKVMETHSDLLWVSCLKCAQLNMVQLVTSRPSSLTFFMPWRWKSVGLGSSRI